ncbi:MAG: esterase family protein [Phycisphaera sp.]|nr:esterase family protein [Phycisphaera sp.]
MLNRLWIVASIALALIFAAVSVRADEPYQLGPDSQRQDGVPQGKVTQSKFVSEKAYPGVEHDMWIYVPAQYDGTKPACVMIFQDGGGYVSEKGHSRVPIVFDNLIHKGEMPVTIGIFLNPGVLPAVIPGAKPRRNRSFEYDAMTGLYAQFLIDEVLPSVSKEYKLTDNPEDRALCGISSGGICAFTAAWERPDYFRKVLSYVGSFTNIRGGNNYPSLIRKTEAKPIRVFLQDGEHDLDNLHGHWPLSAQQMNAALLHMGYDVKFEFGVGGHNGKQGGAILPDALRWLWRDYKKE